MNEQDPGDLETYEVEEPEEDEWDYADRMRKSAQEDDLWEG